MSSTTSPIGSSTGRAIYDASVVGDVFLCCELAYLLVPTLNGSRDRGKRWSRNELQEMRLSVIRILTWRSRERDGQIDWVDDLPVGSGGRAPPGIRATLAEGTVKHTMISGSNNRQPRMTSTVVGAVHIWFTYDSSPARHLVCMA